MFGYDLLVLTAMYNKGGIKSGNKDVHYRLPTNQIDHRYYEHSDTRTGVPLMKSTTVLSILSQISWESACPREIMHSIRPSVLLLLTLRQDIVSVQEFPV